MARRTKVLSSPEFGRNPTGLLGEGRRRVHGEPVRRLLQRETVDQSYRKGAAARRLYARALLRLGPNGARRGARRRHGHRRQHRRGALRAVRRRAPPSGVADEDDDALSRLRGDRARPPQLLDARITVSERAAGVAPVQARSRSRRGDRPRRRHQGPRHQVGQRHGGGHRRAYRRQRERASCA